MPDVPLSFRPVDAGIAMTGEITLQGTILKIGGLKAKILAAHRAGIHTVIIPKENAAELEEIPKKVRDELVIVPVATVDEVLARALLPKRSSPELAGRTAAQDAAIAGS